MPKVPAEVYPLVFMVGMAVVGAVTAGANKFAEVVVNYKQR